MSAVRMFSYAGVVPIKLAANTQESRNSAFVLKEPHLAAQSFTPSGSPQSSTTDLSPQGSGLLRVEVSKGVVIHYEVSLPHQTPAIATATSPTIEGKENLDWGPSYVISILLAGSEA